MRAELRLACAGLLVCFSALAEDATARRREALDILLKNLLPSRPPDNGRVSARENSWEDWLKRTGELPPDFDAMPSIAGLPDPLLMREGNRETRVTTPVQWNQQRQWIRSQIEQWVFGRMPPAPGNVRATVIETRREGRVTLRFVRLEFGPDRRGSLRLELIVPDGPGPFPVFLTNHPRTRPWVNTAVRRGYIGCIYHATDPIYGNGDDSDAYIDLYPEYDFSCLARWAWAASRAVDYLVTLPEVDKGRIGLTGHSRNGKQALLAAAFDERIGAVAASSGNTGECDPWRYTTDMFGNESIQLLTGARPHWFHPRLRFFTGREDKLPVDQNSLMALVAPRGLMLYSGFAESAGNPLGFEQAYRSVLGVYRFLGKEQNVWLRLREGEHATTAGDIETLVDFFDAIFGRKAFPKPDPWVFGYSFEDWQRTSGERLDPLQYPERQSGDFMRGVKDGNQWGERKNAIRKQMAWALGEEPPGLPRPLAPRLAAAPGGGDRLALLFNRPSAVEAVRTRLARQGIGVAGVPFGDDLSGDLFYPAGPDGKPGPGKLPVVVWLHPYTYQNGWSSGSPWSDSSADYVQDQRPLLASLVRRGMAVFVFDQIGFGTRVLHARQFYRRYPKWSLMGKMTADTRAAIDALAALEEIDGSRIHLLGYALGAKVGLLAAAADERVASVASVCGFDPLRRSAGKGAEGVEHYSHLHGLMPRLGFFLGHEARLPFDFDEVLALVAPRPVLVVAPTLDRYARIADVRAELAESRKAYRLLGREEALEVDSPVDFNRFPRRLQERVFDWLA
ncbi:MAG: alpha/beta fold hydrolase, partial [Bryobacterales bacterium]|nr:alpha/beta fold hydrolase [Bryobacterales bacterium]